MKVELLRNDRNRQVLPIPEGNRGGSSQFNPCKGKNLTTRHLGARRAPRVATVHDAVKELDRVLPRPSAIFHAYASADTPWVARTLSHCTPRKRGKVLSLRDPKKSHMCQYMTQTCSPGPDDRSLTDSAGGYQLGASNIRSDNSPFFPSSIIRFPLIAPPGLILNHSTNYSSSQHSNLKPRYKKP
jgi:hypothetical protein